MPITLVTGLPGHGKTLWAIWRWLSETKVSNRPVFYHGIKGCRVPNWQPWEADKWQDLPAGALLIIDEAQKVFPVTGRGQTPGWVQELAVHRHLGLDFVLLTQDPMLLDSFPRRLVDQHFHVVRKFGTKFVTIHEFVNGARDNVAKNRKGSIRHEWRHVKEIYDLYESAELHTVKSRIPVRVWIFLAVPFVFALMAFMAYQRLKVPPGQEVAAAAPTGGVSAAGQLSPVGRPAVESWGGRGRDRLTPAEYAEAYTPRIPGLAHTAPIYDEVTRPAQAPYPAACVLMRGMCRCYTQQATRLDVPAQLCKDIAEGGYFVAWDRPVAHAVSTAAGQAKQAEQPAPGLIGINAGGAQAAPPQQVAAADLPAQVPPVRRPIHQDPTRP